MRAWGTTKGGVYYCAHRTQEAWERFMCGCCGPDSGVSWVQEQVNKAFTSEKFVIGCVSCKFSHSRQKKEKKRKCRGKSRVQVRMLYVGRLQTGTNQNLLPSALRRLEAGWIRCMARKASLKANAER